MLAEKGGWSYAIMALNAGALFGYLGFGPLAERFGRRPVFGLMCLGSLILLPATYFVPHPATQNLRVLLPVRGDFSITASLAAFRFICPSCIRRGSVLNWLRLFASMPDAFSPPRPLRHGLAVTMLRFNNAVRLRTIALITCSALAILPFATETKVGDRYRQLPRDWYTAVVSIPRRRRDYDSSK